MSKFLVLDTYNHGKEILPYSICSISNSKKTAMAYINRKNNKEDEFADKDTYIIVEAIKFEIIKPQIKLENYGRSLE